MIKNWNRTGKIKAIILLFIFILTLISPIPSGIVMPYSFIFVPFLFGCISIPLLAKFNSLVGRKMLKPNWNDNPIGNSNPLALNHFFALFFLTNGTSMLIGTGIKFFAISFFGLLAISFGLGIYGGILLALRFARKQ